MSIKDKFEQLYLNQLKSLVNNNSEILINAFYVNRTSLLLAPDQHEKLPSIPSVRFDRYGRLIRGHKEEGLPVIIVELHKTIDQLKVTFELPNDLNLIGPILAEHKPLTASVDFNVTTGKDEHGNTLIVITEPLDFKLLDGTSLIDLGMFIGQSSDERVSCLKPERVLSAVIKPINFINQLSSDLYYNNLYFRNLTFNN